MGFRTRLILLTLTVVLVTLGSAYAYLVEQAQRDTARRVQLELGVRLALIEGRVAAASAGLGDLPTWDALADALGAAGRCRVTLIRKDGVVLGDSEVALDGLPSVENHLGRPEVAQALNGEVSGHSRLSTTVDRELLYVAKPWLVNGEIVGALRVGLETVQLASISANLYRQLTIAGVLGLLVAFLGSSLVAQVVTTSVRRLTKVAERMAAGDLEARGDVNGGGEFGTLALTLNGLAQNLSKTLGQLRDERDRLTRVLSSMHEGVLLLDQEGRIQLVNTAAQEMLLLGSHAIGEKFDVSLTDADLIARLGAALEHGENSSGEIRLGPSTRRVLANVRRLRQRSGALAVLVDITDRRRLETVRQEFVANASHELRTPVTAIVSAVETIEGPAAGDAEATKTFVDIIARNARRLSSLVNDLLELSQLEAESFVAECSALNVQGVFDTSLGTFQAAARQKGIELSSSVPAGCAVWANPKGLEHVLGNLLQNAINYCPTGSRVTLSARVTEGGIALSVADTGPGIAKEHLERLFERFYRVDTGRSRNVAGTGLGLSIVRHWVEAMGGRVSVQSDVGRGTTFTVTLRDADSKGERRLPSSPSVVP